MVTRRLAPHGSAHGHVTGVYELFLLWCCGGDLFQCLGELCYLLLRSLVPHSAVLTVKKCRDVAYGAVVHMCASYSSLTAPQSPCGPLLPHTVR